MAPLFSLDGDSKFSNMITTIKSKTSANIVMAIVFLLSLLAIGIYYYYTYVAPKLKPGYNSHIEGMSNKAPDAEILLFYADWCPHCKTAKPIWEEIKQKYQGKEVNGRIVTFTEINSTEETPEVSEMMQKYNVEGFPTIKLIKDDQIIDFDANPTESTLTQFLTTAV